MDTPRQDLQYLKMRDQMRDVFLFVNWLAKIDYAQFCCALDRKQADILSKELWCTMHRDIAGFMINEENEHIMLQLYIYATE